MAERRHVLQYIQSMQAECAVLCARAVRRRLRQQVNDLAQQYAAAVSEHETSGAVVQVPKPLRNVLSSWPRHITPDCDCAALSASKDVCSAKP